ncbi:uncharacterized protein TrAtP1_000665 [Trichoderma atroviride]|uniref:uncharacterized protein n=1 Tax=Hypocrea atroviridis TaxID=63577 RepID=UPI003320A80C|nr:hypothetical protein TrAtP1_000665 [Trichoderma atroviride]
MAETPSCSLDKAERDSVLGLALDPTETAWATDLVPARQQELSIRALLSLQRLLTLLLAGIPSGCSPLALASSL